MDLYELKNNGKELIGANEVETPTTENVKDNNELPILPKEENVLFNSQEAVNEDGNDIYSGPGLVIEAKAESEHPNGIPISGIPSQLLQDAMERLNEMDEEIEELKALKEAKEAEQKANETDDEDDDEENDEIDQLSEEELEEKYNEAKVIIDKSGMGTIINFTDEEREKLEKVKVIKLEEVETVSLETLSIKKTKPKKGQIDKIIKKRLKTFSTPIVLPASGYTAVMSGCSTHELVALMQNAQNPVLEAETKWSLIHSKIVETSIGDMDFDTFLHKTASVDYNVFLYGIICATYPEQDKLTLNCPNKDCKKTFEHTYDVRSLIRAERMSPQLQETIMRIVDSSYSLNSAKEVHETAPISRSKLVKLPDSGIVVELAIQSAYDFMYKSMKELSEIKDVKYNEASILSSVVRRALIPDEDGEYIEVTSPTDIVSVIYNLRDPDIVVITKMGEEIMKDLTLEFGFMNARCPRCGKVEKFIEIPLDYILFFKYQQALSTKVE